MSGENRGGSGIERLLLVLAVAALALALALSEWNRLGETRALRKDAQALQETVSSARSEAQAALAAVIAPETVAAASRSVYLIVVDGQPRGTAFVIDREHGILGAAAHTAESLPLDVEGADVHILNRWTPHPIPVTGRKIHAGYGTFREVVEDYQPIRKTSSIYAPRAVPVRDIAFDAARIFVDPIDPETGENRLGSDLSIAPEEDLEALAAGAPIAVIGYPYDTLDNGLSVDAAVSRIERGVISAMIAPLDSAAEPPNSELANIIIHRLSTAGGSSGGPVIDAKGDVVGIHTHGLESISSNADGAAQRADLLYDLASEERENARISGLFKPAWRHVLSTWAKAEDVLPWSFYMEYAAPGREPAPTVGDIDYSANPPFERNVRSAAFSDAVEELRVSAPDAEMQNAGRSSFLIEEEGQYAQFWFSVDRSKETVLFAYDYSLRGSGGSCKLTSFVRKRGAVRMEVMRNRSSFELHFPATVDGTEDYQVVLQRSSVCDPLSQSFFIGEIAWPAADAELMTASLKTTASGFGTDSADLGIAHTMQASITKFFACSFDRNGQKERCREPEYLEISG